jgi:hypothetical protein
MSITRIPLVVLSLLSAGGLAAVGAPADRFGPEVKGLRAKVTLDKPKYMVGEPIKVTYRVKNVSEVNQVLWHSGFWPNHQVLVQDARGKEPPLTAWGQQGRRAFSPGGGRDKNFPLELKAGDEDATEGAYDLMKIYDLSRPGRYTVQYVYEEKQGGWQGRLPSNKADFEVVAKEEKGRMAESKAVEVSRLRFTARAAARVPVPPPGAAQEVDLGLQITNVSDKPVTIRVNDVIRPRLVSEDGEATGLQLGRDGTPRPKPPVTLEPGASWTWRPEARLAWVGGDRSTLHLHGPDGHGVPGFWSFGTIKQRKYRLSIEYTNKAREQDGVALWVGSATTREVELEVVAQQQPGR